MPFAILNFVFIFVLGSVLGSFFNVCIHRLPRGESVARPPSHCPGCLKSIAWFDNVPLLSIVFLRGRCRFCNGRISPGYFLIELLTAAAFVWIFARYGATPAAFSGALLFSLLLIAAAVDLEHQIIPDETSLGGLVAAVILSALAPGLHGETKGWMGLFQSLTGALVGGGIVYATGLIGSFVFRRDAMGGGDVKLLAMAGAFLGWKKVLLVYLIAPIAALPVGLYAKFVRRLEIIPYGPFLSLAAWIAFVWGEAILAWYLPEALFY